MSEEIRFHWALGISLCIHLVIINYFSFPSFKTPGQMSRQKPVEVIYPKILQESPVYFSHTKDIPSENLKNISTIRIPDGIEVVPQVPSDFANFNKMIEFRPHVSKAVLQQEENFDTDFQADEIKPRISVPFLESDKTKNPKYLSYNQAISERIKRQAYTYIHHPQFEDGHVCLTFVLTSSGILKDLRINDHLTSANAYLRDVSLKSILESNPFPPFPKDLNFFELTFNVAITFEVNH